VNAIILAAGRGNRMKNYTENSPKCLINFQGKALLEWQIEALRGAGIKRIAIVTGYRRELIASYGLIEFYNDKWAETEMVASLERGDQWLRSSPCIVSYSDIWYNKRIVHNLLTANGDIAIAYDPNWLRLWTARFGDPLLDAESFRLSPNGTLLEIGNKPSSVNEIEGQYMGLFKITPSGWNEIQIVRSNMSLQDRTNLQMTGTLQKVIEANRIPIHSVACHYKWAEFDSPTDLTCLGQ
jgi:L-glutamine-phosphate cytidylyltransferase